MSNKVTTSLEGVNSNLSAIILTGKHDVFPYENGKRISEVKIATKFTGVLPGNCLSPLSIKVEGADPLPDISNEKISEACTSMKFLLVHFADCIVTLYTNTSGQLGMTATASGATLLNNGK